MNFYITRNLFIILFISGFSLHAATIRGHIKDAQTGDPLIEATVFIKGTSLSAITNLEGLYILKNIPMGEYTLTVSYLGYIQQEQAINVVDVDGHYVLNFSMPEESKIITVEVVGTADKESAKYALNQEKNADNISNVISAKTIQLLPDITVAGVLQRVSGVSLDRTSTGDARYAIIRGMDQRYNYTLVNGIKIPSPDNKFRYVPMDMFPADLIERLEVSKSLTPSMEGDAIGGAMNLVMKDAPDHFVLNANVGGGFSQLLANRGYTNFSKSAVTMQSPADINGQNYIAPTSDFSYNNFNYTTRKLPINSVLGFSIGDRFFKNKKLGALVGVSYQNLYRGTNSTFFQPDAQPAANNVPIFDDMYARQYNTNQQRYGLHAKIDYKFNDKHKISLYNMYMKLDEIQYRFSSDTSLTAGRNGYGTGNIYNDYRSRAIYQSIYNSTLQGEHTFFDQYKSSWFRGLKLTWSGVYSLAKGNTPDWSNLEVVNQIENQKGNLVQTSPPNIYSLYKIWIRNTDRDLAGYLNLSRHFNFWGQEVTITSGLLYRDKLRNNYYNEYDFNPVTSAQGTPPVYSGQQLTPDMFEFYSPNAAKGAPQNANTYTATEKIFSYYGQAKIILFKRYEVLGGLRVENTQQGWTTAVDPNALAGAYGLATYTDYLPSVNCKYLLTKKQNIRLSYYSAINRPGFAEYIPFRIHTDTYDEIGNPLLKHATSNNYDLRYEYFPKGLDQLLAGVFYKTITNPIEAAVAYGIGGGSAASIQPQNFGTATNYGFELAITKYFGKFGISGNYTYTHSAITTPKEYWYLDSSQQAAHKTVSQTRPLQGQSPHIANLSFLYKNKKLGLDFQLAAIYTGKKIVLVSAEYNLDYWQRGVTQLDFSVEKRLFKYFTLYCKVSNLLNTPVVVDILQNNTHRSGRYAFVDQTSNDKITVQKDYYGQTYLLGIRFKI